MKPTEALDIRSFQNGGGMIPSWILAHLLNPSFFISSAWMRQWGIDLIASVIELISLPRDSTVSENLRQTLNHFLHSSGLELVLGIPE